jgi:hypothetical protein
MQKLKGALLPEERSEAPISFYYSRFQDFEEERYIQFRTNAFFAAASI